MVRILFEGSEACFTRPELKVERVSYEVPTPSAMRGMIEAIYWHPGIKWIIQKIYILNPIKMYTIKRNEVGKIGSDKNCIYTSECREQRSSRVLKDVSYVVEASFELTEKANASDNPGKIQDIITRRIKKGQCFTTPYFGNREFSARFLPWEEKEIPTQPINKEYGIMFYDFDYNDNVKPTYFNCIVKDGVIDLTNVEVLR